MGSIGDVVVRGLDGVVVDGSGGAVAVCDCGGSSSDDLYRLGRRDVSSEKSRVFPNFEVGEETTGLRDYFAGQAMQHMSIPTRVTWTESSWRLDDMSSFPFDQMATVAYLWADAMMKAREQ